jgi:NADPH-dependent glutamate synthase beta subunit-like oxidoreductase/CO/xanthine dehydrogenase FAD-binding subunit
MTLRPFDHVAVRSLEEAAALRCAHGARSAVIAGGTDLLGGLKDRVHPESPQLLIDIKASAGASRVSEDGTTLRIGSLTTLAEVADHEVVNARIPLLAQAARAVGSPQIRNMATVGGNICQEPRCWYYRAPDNAFYCLRKGGQQCAALLGDNRYHSIFGAARVPSPPCAANCPAHIDIPAYLALVREGDWRAAARLLLERNPMPAVTGRVCPHFCEMDCNRCEMDGAVATRAVERYLGDWALSDIPTFFQPPSAATDKHVAIVGSGPAGLAAAYYLRRRGHGVTVFDALGVAGGMLAHSIPHYRLPKVVVQKQIEALGHMGVEFVLGTSIDSASLTRLSSDFDSTFLATGAWRDKTIGIDGAEHLQSGLQFLIDIQNGLRRAPGARVLVIGGGGVAVDVALSARRLGAERVTMVCLESREVMPAPSEEIDQALAEGVQLLPSWGPRRVLMNEGDVTGMELVRCTSVFDAVGRFSPSFDPATTLIADADCVLLAIGQEPDLPFPAALVPTDGRRITVTDQGACAVPGLFAGGDAVTGPASVVEAVAAGWRAATAIDSYLGGSALVSESDQEATPSSLVNIRADALSPVPRAPSVSAPSGRDIETEDVATLDLAAVKGESKRCLDCACVAVNASDLAPALIALGARIRTTRRLIEAERFFAVGVMRTTVLDPDELVAEIEIPLPPAASIQSYRKFRIRQSIDFPIVSVASILSLHEGRFKEATIVLGAVAPVPLRASEAERFLVGRRPDAESAEAAAAIAVRTACPLPKNAFKAQIVRALVREAVLEAAPAREP